MKTVHSIAAGPNRATGFNVDILVQALSATTAGVLITDCRLPDHPIIYCNPAFERLTGYTAEEVLGKNCRFLQGDDHDQPALCELRDAIRRGRDCRVVLRNYKKDGTLFWNELTLSPIRDDADRVTHFVGIQNDISAKKELESALLQRKQFLKTVMVNIPDMVGYWTRDLRCGYANHQYLKWFGRTVEQMQGITIQELMGPELFRKNEPYIRAVLEGKDQQFERTIIKPDGEAGHTWAKYVAHKVDGVVQGFFVLVTDITEVKRLEEALKAANDRLERKVADRTGELSRMNKDLQAEIAARKTADMRARQLAKELNHLNRLYIFNELSMSIIHQLSQPLGAIANNASAAQLAVSKPRGPAGLQGILADILEDCGRAREIIDKNRGLLRKDDYVFRDFDLSQCIQDVMASLQSHLILNNVALVLDAGPSVVVKGDRVHIEQVLLNLCMNAIESMQDMPADSPLRKDLRIHAAVTEPGTVTVSVKDRGQGFSRQAKRNLFKPFFTTKESGLGLGLPICRSIIEAHQGRFWGENSDEGGRSSTFPCRALPGGTHEREVPHGVHH